MIGWLDEYEQFLQANRDAMADLELADARARAERRGWQLRHPQLTRGPQRRGDVPAAVTGWAGCGTPEAVVAAIAYPPAPPWQGAAESELVRILREWSATALAMEQAGVRPTVVRDDDRMGYRLVPGEVLRPGERAGIAWPEPWP